MSKIHTALKKAEAERLQVSAGVRVHTASPQELPAAVQEEIRLMERAISQWQHVPVAVSADGAGAPCRAERPSPEPVPQHQPAASPVVEAGPADLWERRVQELSDQLLACEQQAARHAEERARLQQRLAQVSSASAELANQHRRVLQQLGSLADELAAVQQRAEQLQRHVNELQHRQPMGDD